jgi:hypothetical protein
MVFYLLVSNMSDTLLKLGAVIIFLVNLEKNANLQQVYGEKIVSITQFLGGFNTERKKLQIMKDLATQ